MLKQAVLIMECSRIFSLPTTIFSWLVIFVYSLINSGNLSYGLVAFVGLVFAHLGTNLLDDYFDYKYLIKRVDFDRTEYLKCSQKTKCRYLISGKMSEFGLLRLAGIYFLVASICGLFLFLKCGIGVLYFALVGAIIALIYPIASRICLSELMVGLAYGPALFGGVYYVMCGTYSVDVFLLSIPTMLMTIILLFVHTIMDYDFDIAEGKKTLANIFKSKSVSLKILKWLLILSYLSIFIECIFDILDWQIFFVCLTIPMAVDLYKSLSKFIEDSESLPQKKWYHFPMENLKEFEKRNEASFMVRMFQSRNLMMYFSVIVVIAIFCVM